MNSQSSVTATAGTTTPCLESHNASIDDAVDYTVLAKPAVEQPTPNTDSMPINVTPLTKVRKTQILQQLANFSSKTTTNARQSGQKTRRNQAASAQSNRGQQERQVDLQIWLLHQAMVNKLLAEPARLPALVAKLEQQLAAGQIRHGAYLFWSSAFALLAQPELAQPELAQHELFRAAILSTEPSANKYRRRTFMVGLLTEEERQQALLAPLPE